MSDYPYDLGPYTWPVTTTSPQAQVWIDRGMSWTYGYNHEEAVACFRKALEHDPGCAMAHWGVAYAIGPNYNMSWELFDDAGRAEALRAGHDAVQAALGCLEDATPVERAMVQALVHRFPQRDLAPLDQMARWNDAFADAMRAVHKAHPDSLEARCVFVEAMMNRTPWQMWDLARAEPAPGADTRECEAVLDEVFASDPTAWKHPGLLHLHVHLMEMSPYPERALRTGDALRTIGPDLGHLVHMPTHIDVLCGAYHDVVHWNQQAVIADQKYFQAAGAYNIYSGYRLHNYHFVIYGAMFLGQLDPALKAERGIWDTPEEMLRIESPPMADYFESFFVFKPKILVRFGLWDQAAAMELPEDQDLFCSLTAFTLYARGVANAALGRVEQALEEEQSYLAACARVPDSRLMHNNRVVDLLEVGKFMLRGEILYRQGDYDAAFDALRHAVHLEDTLPYDEPWGWMQPVRHALGALLLEQGHVTEAEAVFREDLGLGGQLSRATVHPDNVWALRGLHDCLKARGETVERVAVRQRLDLALARADRRVGAACFCARSAST